MTDFLDVHENTYYTLTCDFCGEEVIQNLLSGDYDRPLLLKSMLDKVEAHNLTHAEDE